MGQGFCTAMVQCLCEITGIDPRLVRTEVDTNHPTPCGMTTASRATVLGGRAVQEAARKMKADLIPGVRLADLAGRGYLGEYLAGPTTPLGSDAARPRTHLTYGFATQVCILDARGRVERVVAAHDVGTVINRHMVEGQIEGAVHMGLGYALTEELPLANGVPESFKLRSLGLIRARDMPEVTVILVESDDPEGPFGAKGVGEIGLVPTAGAVANALYRFDGVRRTSLPMKDSAAARAMLGARGSGLGARRSGRERRRHGAKIDILPGPRRLAGCDGCSPQNPATGSPGSFRVQNGLASPRRCGRAAVSVASNIAEGTPEDAAGVREPPADRAGIARPNWRPSWSWHCPA